MTDDYWRDAFWRKHDNELREYANAGITQDIAADKLGISKVFVKSQCKRLKIKWVRGDSAKPKRKPSKPKPKEPETVKPKPTPKRKREREPSQIEIEERKRIWDFPDSGRCVFPMGDPGADGFRFCAEDAIEGRSYCDEHRRLCYYHGSVKKAGAVGDVAGD